MAIGTPFVFIEAAGAETISTLGAPRDAAIAIGRFTTGAVGDTAVATRLLTSGAQDLAPRAHRVATALAAVAVVVAGSRAAIRTRLTLP
jgi:hypothetical protein